MPRGQVSAVTTGGGNEHWQSTVKNRAALIEERIGRLRSPDAYLLHLL